MKLFKKTYPLVGIMLLLCSGTFLAKDKPEKMTKDRVLGMINNIHLKVFDKDNLFAKKNEDTDTWNQIFSHLKAYVHKNAGKNRKLLNAFSVCRITSDELIRTLTSVYDSVFSGKKRAISLEDARENANIMLEELMIQQANLKGMGSILEDTRYYIEKKKDVKEVLLRLILTLDITIDKLGEDFKKIQMK